MSALFEFPITKFSTSLLGRQSLEKKEVKVFKVMGPALDFVFVLVAKNDKSTILAKNP